MASIGILFGKVLTLLEVSVDSSINISSSTLKTVEHLATIAERTAAAADNANKDWASMADIRRQEANRKELEELGL